MMAFRYLKPQGNVLVTGARDSTIRLWDVSTGQVVNVNKAGSFHDIGHCLWTLVLATIGGLFASWLGRRGMRWRRRAGE
jgi:WD40 repeat protein